MYFISRAVSTKLAVVLSCLIPGTTLACKSGRDEDVALSVGGIERTAVVHLPPKALDEGKSDPLPLVINIHALLGTAKLQQDLSKFDDIADGRGACSLINFYRNGDDQFIVAYPQGYAVGELPENFLDDLASRFISTYKSFLANLVKQDLTEWGFSFGQDLAEFASRLQQFFTGDDAAPSSFNAGGCCVGRSTAAKNIDEIGFFRKLIEHIQNDMADRVGFTIDRERIYVTGMSNGGFMTHRVACEMSDIIAAVAPIAGVMFDNTAERKNEGSLPELAFQPDKDFKCEPERPIPLLHIHSKGDSVVPYDGGEPLSSVQNFLKPIADGVVRPFSSEPLEDGAIFGFPSVDKSIEFWKRNNNVADVEGVSDTIRDNPFLWLPSFQTDCVKWTPTDDAISDGTAAVVELCTHNNGLSFFGHCYPSKSSLSDLSKLLPSPPGESHYIPPFLAYCKNGVGSQYIWDFFKQHKLPSASSKDEVGSGDGEL